MSDQRQECCICGEDIKEDQPTVVRRERDVGPQFWDEAHKECAEGDDKVKRITPYWRLPLG